MGDGDRTSDGPGAPNVPPVAFVHIPKTAGGTTISMLTNAFGRAGVRDVGNYLRGHDKTVAKVRRAVNRKQSARVYAGHVPFAVFRQHFPDDTTYVTILREPVERVLSHYYRHLDAERTEGSGKSSRVALEEVLALRLPQVSNLQTRFLCDDPDPPAEMPPEALDQATTNMNSMAFVGLQERFDESLVLLQRTLGVDIVVSYMRNRHVGGERPSAEDLDPDLRALIEEANALDIELYTRGRDRFEAAVRNAGDGFDADVESLRAQGAAAVSETESVTAAATQWLQEQLPPGTSRPINEVLAAATEAGLSHQAVRQAARGLRIVRGDALGGKVWTGQRPAGGAAEDPPEARRRSPAREAKRAARAERRRVEGKRSKRDR